MFKYYFGCLILVVFSQSIAAKCLSEHEIVPTCRYPAGDNWCAKNQPNRPLAHTDDCLQENNPPASSTVSATSNNDIALDKFLSGVEHQCQYSQQLELFNQLLIDGAYQHDFTRAHNALPAQLQNAVGTAYISEQDDSYWLVNVPIHNGTWQKLPVHSLEFLIGNGSGFNSLIVNFEQPAQPVLQQFKRIIEQSQRKMSQDPDNFATIEMRKQNGRAQIICDFSM
jgi:hypothetical protein